MGISTRVAQPEGQQELIRQPRKTVQARSEWEVQETFCRAVRVS